MKHSVQLRAGSFSVLFALFLIALLSYGCTKGPMPVCHPNYYHARESKAIAQEISRLEAIIEKGPDNPENPVSYFYLALLYAHYNNPAPDYPHSLSMLEKYLSLNPDGGKKDEGLYLKTLLQGLVETDKKRALSQQEVKKLKQQAGKLTEKNKKLISENQNLKEAIEKLKLLDLQLEEKRLKY